MAVDTHINNRWVDHDETPSMIKDHSFVPRSEWWSLCKVCGLAQAAHSESTISFPFDYNGDGFKDDT